MNNPFFKEEYKWYDIELYNSEEVAENRVHAQIHRFTSDNEPSIDKIVQKAKELGCDTYAIKEKTEIEKHYSVNDVN